MPIPKNAAPFLEVLESYRLLVERGFEGLDVLDIPRVEFAKRGFKYRRLLLHYSKSGRDIEHRHGVWVDSFVEKSTGNIYIPQSFTRPFKKAKGLLGNIYRLDYT